MRSGRFQTYLVILLIFLLLSGKKASAQYDAQISQYMLAPGLYNPAVAGENSDLNISIVNRQQWVGIENAPSTLFAHASMPFAMGQQKHGFGFLVMKESIGLFSTQWLQLQYAWKKKVRNGMLSIGFQGGILQQTFDSDGISIPTSDYHNSSDASIPTGSLEGLIPDISMGIWYRKGNNYLGLSASHLLESTIKLKTSADADDEDAYEMVASRTYYLTDGYNIALSNPLYSVQPSFLLKTDLTAWQLDLSGKVLYKEKYWGGLGWRYQDAIIIMAGIKLPQGLNIGYSYDISTSAVAKFAGGSHEIYLGYTRKIGTATTSKRQKSVRIL
jgi:type IX secretion system PorP/SprF family membrane protein